MDMGVAQNQEVELGDMEQGNKTQAIMSTRQCKETKTTVVYKQTN